MSLLFAFLFGIAFGALRHRDQYNYMRKKELNSTNSSGLLGVCYGQKTKWANDPYVVALRYPDGSACCSGSIASLDPPVIITAAHCYFGGCTGDVFIGCNNPAQCDGDSYTIQTIWYLTSYDPVTLYNDIALYVLTSPITTERAEAVEIPPFEPEDGTIRIVGYGRDESGQIPTHLIAGSSQLLNRQYCNDVFSEVWGQVIPPWIDISMTCIMDQSGNTKKATQVCFGDSGGPWGLRRGNQAMQQYGIISWVSLSGSSCPEPTDCACCLTLPSVGANLPYFSGFVDFVIDVSIDNKGDFNDTHYGDKMKKIQKFKPKKFNN